MHKVTDRSRRKIGQRRTGTGCAKIAYATRLDAKAAAKRVKRLGDSQEEKGHLGPYRCECGGWHLGHSRDRAAGIGHQTGEGS